MIDTNLGSSGRVELQIISNNHFGKKIKIIRRYKQSPVILDEYDKVSNLSIIDILPSVEIYGQNEIMDAVGDLPALQERLQFYNEAGLVDKLSIIKKLATEEGQFKNFAKSLPKENIEISEVTIAESDNEELSKLAKAVKNYNTVIINVKSEYFKAVSDLKTAYNLKKDTWTKKKSQYDQEIKGSLKQIEGIQDKSSSEITNDYSELIKKVELATPVQARLEVI